MLVIFFYLLISYVICMCRLSLINISDWPSQYDKFSAVFCVCVLNVYASWWTIIWGSNPGICDVQIIIHYYLLWFYCNTYHMDIQYGIMLFLLLFLLIFRFCMSHYCFLFCLSVKFCVANVFKFLIFWLLVQLLWVYVKCILNVI